MRPADKLSQAELVDFVTQLQRLLFQEHDGVWDPHREWNSDTFDEISGLLHAFGLAPESNPASASV